MKTPLQVFDFISKETKEKQHCETVKLLVPMDVFQGALKEAERFGNSSDVQVSYPNLVLISPTRILFKDNVEVYYSSEHSEHRDFISTYFYHKEETLYGIVFVAHLTMYTINYNQTTNLMEILGTKDLLYRTSPVEEPKEPVNIHGSKVTFK